MSLSTTRMLRPVLLAALIAGCKEVFVLGPPCENPQGGVFIGEASGAQTGSLRGCSSYAITSSGGSDGMGLVASAGPIAAPTTVVNLARTGSRPGMGSYTIGTGTGNFAGSVFLSAGGRTFSLTTGGVTIDVSTAGELQGSFNVTGTQSGTGTSITVTGTFTSVCSAGGSVTC